MKSNGTAVLSAATDSIGTCAVRTFVCTGDDELATIEVNDSDLGTISDEGTVTLLVNSCKKCADDLITITTNGNGAQPMTAETRDESGACTTRTFVCEGPHAVIEVNAGAGSISGNGRATITVACNSGETNWVAAGVTIKQLECSYGPK